MITEFIHQIFEKKLWKFEFSLKKNEILVTYGSVSDDIFLVKSGSLIITTTIDDSEQIIRLGYKNSLIATIDSFLNNTPTIYQIKAIKESVILKTDKKTLQPLFEKNPELYNARLIELINQQNERELDLLTHSAIRRFERLLQRSPQAFQEIPHKYIASYLRISPETLSRLLKF